VGFKPMRVLLDTNVLIHREDPKVISADLQKLLKILQENGHQTLIHPASFNDISNDKNVDRRNVILSKIAAYPQLENPPVPDDQFYQLIGNLHLDSHSMIDMQMLYSVYKNAVHVFVTEDKEVHRFALKLGIENRVLDIVTALADFDNTARMHEHFRIKSDYMYNIDHLDPFFDSLREDYGTEKFNKWFVEKSQEGRRCWVHRIDHKLKAILILKDEDEEVAFINNVPLQQKPRLKISTLKVVCRGYRVGELLLKLAIGYSIDHNQDEIYLTHFVKENDDLLKLITKHGFEYVGERSRTDKQGNHEKVYLKKLFPDNGIDYNPAEFNRRFYPSFIDSARVNKFIVPIQPEYHDRLFQNYKKRQTQLIDFSTDVPQGNTIRKAYLTNFHIKNIKPGDLLLFYRSRDQHQVTSIGVVEQFHYQLDDTDKIWYTVEYNRSVYSYDEVKGFKKPVTVIIFRHYFNLKKPLGINELTKNGIFSAHPQSISSLTLEQYSYIKRNGGIDGRFAFD
jgi:hypothetical protein